VIEPKYQTFWPRFLAGVVDGLVFLPLSFLNVAAYQEGVPIWVRSIWYVLWSFAFVTYVVVMHALYGQTLGKMANHVKVLDVSESKLSWTQAFMREAVRVGLTLILVVYKLPRVVAGEDPNRPVQPEMLGFAVWLALAASGGWFAAELITMLTNSKRRAVHDFIAGSVVVRHFEPPIEVSRGVI